MENRVSSSRDEKLNRLEDLGKWLAKLDLGETTEHYLGKDFDVKDHANSLLQSGIAISDQLAKISEGVILLNKELHAQVVAHHDDLLSQATGVETLEGVLNLMHGRIQSLLSTTERIRNKITEPFSRITVRMNQLKRLQETCDLLRRIIRILYLTKRLRVQLQGGVREITKTAQSLSELRTLSEGVDLTGIEVLENDRRIITQAKTEVDSQARKMLSSGISGLNQNQVGTALQVFYNLNELSNIVSKVVRDSRDSVKQAVSDTFDQRALAGTADSDRTAGPGRVSLPVNSAVFRANLWTAMEKLMDLIFTSCSQVNHLQRVLVKKRDPVTQACFINEYSKDADPHILVNYWIEVTSIFGDGLVTAANGSNLVKQALEGEFPKLLRLLNDLWVRLNQMTPAQTDLNMALLDNELVSAPSLSAEERLREAVVSFNTAYLSRSLSRLFDPINLIFPQGSLSVPTHSEVEGVIDTISSELKVAGCDVRLASSIAKNISKTVKLFAVKCEQLLSTDGEASQVIEAATAGQRRNAAVVNSLHYLQTSMTRLLGESLDGYDKHSTEDIRDSVKGLSVLMTNAIEPLLSSINDSMEAIILTMHQEDFSSDTPSQSESQCSLYMRELQGFLSRVNSEYLTMFECTDFVLECLRPYVCNGIELFVQHASLLRPLGEGGKMRLAADFAQMELAVHPLCKRVSDLGKSYKLLRAFRPLLFQTNDHILHSHAVGDILPYSTVLHYLFTRVPSQLKSPHQVASWSLSRYTNWLENHPTEADRLTLIKGALEAYAKSVSSSGETEYATVYPIMLKLLQKGLSD